MAGAKLNALRRAIPLTLYKNSFDLLIFTNCAFSNKDFDI